MNHIILAGDSIFDNKSYVRAGEPDVVQQLNSILDNGDTATMVAEDGAVTDHVIGQLENIPDDSTHIFISTGGNDGLHRLESFKGPASSMGEGFLKFSSIRQEFEKKYANMLRNAVGIGLPTAVCTIYHPRFDNFDLERVMGYIPGNIPASDVQKISMNGLSIFNDIIFQEAVRYGVPVVDLRLIFNQNSDFANPIEPSMLGGQKMTKVIKKIAYGNDFSSERTVVYK